MTDRATTSNRLAVSSYVDTLAAIKGQPLSVIALLAISLSQLLLVQYVQYVTVSPLGQGIASFVFASLILYLTAPFVVALVRFFAFEQQNRQPWADYRKPATLSVWGWSTLFLLTMKLLDAVGYAGSAMTAPGPESASPLGGVVEAGALIAQTILAVRFVTLIPYAALQPGMVSLRGSFDHSRSYFWTIFIGQLFLVVPLLVFFAGATAIVVFLGFAATTHAVVLVGTQIVMFIPPLLLIPTLLLAFATRAFVHLAPRSRQNPATETTSGN